MNAPSNVHRTATHCNALQRTATHCNCVATVSFANGTEKIERAQQCASVWPWQSHHTNCNALQRTVTHCNTQRSALRKIKAASNIPAAKRSQVMNELQHNATQCNALQRTARQYLLT